MYNIYHIKHMQQRSHNTRMCTRVVTKRWRHCRCFSALHTHRNDRRERMRSGVVHAASAIKIEPIACNVRCSLSSFVGQMGGGSLSLYGVSLHTNTKGDAECVKLQTNKQHYTLEGSFFGVARALNTCIICIIGGGWELCAMHIILYTTPSKLSITLHLS